MAQNFIEKFQQQQQQQKQPKNHNYYSNLLNSNSSTSYSSLSCSSSFCLIIRSNIYFNKLITRMMDNKNNLFIMLSLLLLTIICLVDCNQAFGPVHQHHLQHQHARSVHNQHIHHNPHHLHHSVNHPHSAQQQQQQPPPPPQMAPYRTLAMAIHGQQRAQQQQQHLIPNSHDECEINTDPVIELIMEKMRLHLPDEKITVQNGALTIFDARINRFAELIRIRTSCARQLDPDGVRILLPFEAEIRGAQALAKLKYNFYVTDLHGDYAANFSHIRLNGTLEANLEEEWMKVAQFNITDSRVVDDSINFVYIPKFILDWVRSFIDNDNTGMYEQLAKVILQKEADHFEDYDLIRQIITQSTLMLQTREEEDRVPPLNLL